MMDDGRFREDLYYRLHVIDTIPPLRARKEDVLPLARHFLLDLNTTFHKAIRGFAPETEKLLLGYGWPGNVRELRNLVERLVILTPSDWIEPHHLPPPFVAPTVENPALPAPTAEFGTLAEMERTYIVQRSSGPRNKSMAAKLLGISRQTCGRSSRAPAEPRLGWHSFPCSPLWSAPLAAVGA
jgi:DNA-binding NtrC family response regulator